MATRGHWPAPQAMPTIAASHMCTAVVRFFTLPPLVTIRNFMVGKVSGQAEYAVIEFGGILGMGNDYYPIPWDMLTYDTEKGGYVVDLTKEQLDNAPRHGAAYPEYDHNYGRRVFDYYGMAYPYPFI